MSFNVFFSFSAGLKSAIRAPKGTLSRWKDRVLVTEATLGLVRETWQEKERWRDTDCHAEISDEDYCSCVEEHNRFVRWIHEFLPGWQEKPDADFEAIHPEDVNGFWFDALRVLEVPVERWTASYYRARMEALYDTMRGRSSEGMIFEADDLSEKQAAAVVNLLSQWLDRDDMRLDVPEGYDALYSSEEYDWCPQDGAIHESDSREHGRVCKCEECVISTFWTYDEDDEEE